MKKTPSNDRFRFLTEKTIREEKFEMTRFQSGDLRRKLQKGTFWCQLSKGSLIMWNWTLLNSYLLHGLESPITQSLVEEYMNTLPQAA
jgi:hypothetical protein